MNMGIDLEAMIRVLLRHNNERVIIVDLDADEVVYCTVISMDTPMFGEPGTCRDCLVHHSLREAVLSWDSGDNADWEWTDGANSWMIHSEIFDGKSGGRWGIHILRDKTEEDLRKRELYGMAYRDELTGLYRRVYLEEQAVALFRHKEPFHLIFMDIDALKYVNDKYGHVIGDKYINTFVKNVGSIFREGDIFARMGGDEFALLVKGDLDIGIIEKRLKAKLEEFKAAGTDESPNSVSWGITKVDYETDKYLSDVIKKADKAMYKCKANNKRELRERGMEIR